MSAPAVVADMKLMGRVLERHARLTEQFEASGGLVATNEGRGHLVRLGLEAEAFDLPTAVLSGGQRKIIALAAAEHGGRQLKGLGLQAQPHQVAAALVGGDQAAAGLELLG